MAEGASRHWIATRAADGPAAEAATGGESSAEAQRLAARLADLAWAGLRSVHAD